MCRSCSINENLVGIAGEHSLVDTGVFCMVCQKVCKSIHHPEGDDLYGDSYECNECHDYILYTDAKGTLYKDEIYLDNNYSFIRNIEENESYFLINEEVVYCFKDTLLIYNDAKSLFKKLKTLLVLS